MSLSAMSMNAPARVVFSATGTIQSYLVEMTGSYIIEAAGGQGGAGAGPGRKGARVGGMFLLKRDDRLKIVVGRKGVSATRAQAAGGRGGASMVWTGSSDLPQPIKLMLSASGGAGGTADGNPQADSNGFDTNGAEVDARTSSALATQWTIAAAGSVSRTAKVDRCGYNAGSFRAGEADVHEGNGYVSITPVAMPVSAPPAGSPLVESASPATREDDPGRPPSPTILSEVTPRPKSWASLLRQRGRPDSK